MCGGYNSKRQHEHPASGMDTKRYTCHLCDKKFSSTTGRRAHLSNVHHLEDLKVTCQVCGAKFTQTATRNVHIKKKHPEYAASQQISGQYARNTSMFIPKT